MKDRRNTKQRQIILEELCKLNNHPTADELYLIIRKRLPRISLGTVYRNLDLLKYQNSILKLDAGSGQARFDGNPEKHYHVRCRMCGRIQDAMGISKDFGLDKVKRINGYTIEDYKLDFIGICPGCKKNHKETTEAQ